MSSVTPDVDLFLYLMANPTTIFRQFSRLPKELQLQIWEQVSEPRVIHLDLGRMIPGEIQYRNGRFWRATGSIREVVASAPAPILLRINKESREVGLREYKLMGRSRLLGRPVYINWARDAVFARTHQALATFCNPSGEYLRPDGRRDVQQLQQTLQHLIIGGYEHDLQSLVELAKFTTLVDLSLEIDPLVWILQAPLQQQNLAAYSNDLRTYVPGSRGGSQPALRFLAAAQLRNLVR